MDNLEFKLKNHLLTAFINNSVFNEEDNSLHHNEAMQNICRQATKENIYIYLKKDDPLPEFAWHFIKLGHILVANISTDISELYIIFIPEIYTEEQKNIIKNCINLLNEDNVMLHQRDGENLILITAEEFENKTLKKKCK